jgi:hypothetical protein
MKRQTRGLSKLPGLFSASKWCGDDVAASRPPRGIQDIKARHHKQISEQEAARRRVDERVGDWRRILASLTQRAEWRRKKKLYANLSTAALSTRIMAETAARCPPTLRRRARNVMAQASASAMRVMAVANTWGEEV